MRGTSQNHNTLVPFESFAKSLALITLVSFSVALVLVEGRGQFTLAQTRQFQGEAKLVARGRYIVEGLAACGDCHTPRNVKGEVDRSKWLAGAPVFYEPAQRVPGWAISAPRIAGLPPGSDAEIIKLLTTGVWRGSQTPRPPMPRFHMAREDAEAVVAYLRSL